MNSETKNLPFKSMEQYLSDEEEEEEKKKAKIRLASLESSRRVKAYKRKQKKAEKAALLAS